MDSANHTATEGQFRKLAAGLSGWQGLNQRPQKYKLPTVFHGNVMEPKQNQGWKDSSRSKEGSSVYPSPSVLKIDQTGNHDDGSELAL